MTPTITRTRSESLVIARAHAAVQAADGWLARNQDREALGVRAYQQWITDGLEIREGLEDGTRHPADVYPELADRWPDDAVGQALEQVIRDIADDTGALVQVIREQCGQEGAEFVQSAVDRAEAGQ